MNPDLGEPAHRVFICYRREETAAHAGRLYDAMVAKFGERNVFMDVDLAPGVDFVERIADVVAGCQVLIVVMGPTWATVKDEEGQVRIADPEDFIRLEVGTGLRSPDVTPIPVLVSGARMPKREALPQELQAITRRNALELSEARWRYDVGRLNSTLDELLTDLTRTRGAIATPPQAQASVDARKTSASLDEHPVPGPSGDRPASGPSDGRLFLEGALVGGAAAAVGRKLANAIPDSTDTAGAIANVVLTQTETWAIAGVALAVWLATRTRRGNLLSLGVIGLIVGALGGAVGGASYALPIHLPDPNLTKENAEAADAIRIAALAITGGFLGALIGNLWRHPRLGAGLASGAVAGAVAQLILNGSSWEKSHPMQTFGVKGAAIAGLTLATLLALDRQRLGARTATDVRVADP